MANEKVVLRRGPSSSIPSAKVPGTILVETDTGRVYVDDSATSRVQFKDDTKLPVDGKAVDSEKADFATKAEALSNTTAIGSVSQGVYIDKNGLPVKLSYQLNKTVPSDAVFTDTKVTQAANTSNNIEYPILLGYSASTSSVTNTVNKAAGFTYNPADKELTVNDVNAQNISVKNLTVAGQFNVDDMSIDDGCID